MDRVIGSLGAAATCALAFLFGSENCDFSFEAATGLLSWSRQRGFFKPKGSAALDSIGSVVLQSCLGNDRYYPKHRVVLVIKDQELPLTIAYEHDAMNEVIAEWIRAFIGKSSKSLTEDSLEELVADGRHIDPIRLLREKTGVSLSEAHRVVRAGKIDMADSNKSGQN
jgi:hypothetical protein